MTLGELGRAISIIRDYYDDPDGYHISTDHDVFYFHATDRPMTHQDVAALGELGFFQEGAYDGTNLATYAPDRAWTSFT